MFTNDIFFLYGRESSVVTAPDGSRNDMRCILLEAYPYDAQSSSIRTVNFSSGRRTSSVNGSSAPFYVRLREDFSFLQLVFPENLPSDRQASIGQISVNNSDGALDGLLELDWGARTLTLKKGYEDYDYNQFFTFFSGSTVELTATKNNVILTLRDNGYKLQKPLQPNKYTGGGGKEGPVDLREAVKPLLFGKAKNITPVLLDEILQLYQITDGSMASVEAVYDRAVPLTESIDFVSFELLAAAVIPNGSYATCLAEGLLRLGAPAERITVDAVGQFSSAPNLSSLVQAVLLSRGLTISDLSTASWNEFASDFPYEISGMYYSDPSVEISEWLQNVLSSAFSFYYFDELGRLSARQFRTRPSVGIIRANRVMSLSKDSSPKPIHRVFIDYDRNLTVNKIGDYTLGFQDLIAYLRDDKIFVATAADGTGGVFSYTGQVTALIEEVDVSDTGAVEFRKITSAPWLTLSPNGSFTLTDPGVDAASCTIRVSARKIYRDVTFTIVKSKGANPRNLSLSGTNRLFLFDTFGLPSPALQETLITATLANVPTPLTWEARDNLGRVIPLSGTGNSRTLSISNVFSSQQMSLITVTATSQDGLTTNTHQIAVYNRSSGSSLSLPVSPGASVQSVRVSVDQAVVKFNSAGVMTPPAQTPVFSASVSNIVGVGTWTFEDNLGTSSATLASLFSFPTGTTAQASASLWATTGRIQVKATFTVGGMSDTETILRVDDGSGGLLGYLTNTAHNPPADGSGVVSSYTGSSGKFRVFYNGQEVTSSATYTVFANPNSLITSIDSDGDYEVTASGSWPNASDTTTITYRASYTPAGASALTVDQVFSLSKSRAGVNGSGLSIASIFLFQRTATNTPPAKPTSTTTYTFLTGVLSGSYSPWSQTIPVSGGQYLWVTLATATADTSTDSILASEWADVSLYGLPGSDGFSSSVVFIYQRSPSAPAAPTGTVTYDFTTGAITGLDNGWSGTIPTADGNPLWIRTATAFGTGTDTIATGEWTTSRQLATNGADGIDGIDGTDGKLIEFVWKRSATIPPTPTGNGIPVGWTDDPPSGTDPLWMSKSKQELDGTLVFGGSWSIPIRHDGPPGLSLSEWIAYANSPNGTVDFTTGAPGGRAYIGRAANKTTSVESTNPADYDWTQYKGPPGFGLVPAGLAIVASDLILVASYTGSWTSASVYSSESHTGGCSLSFKGEDVDLEMMIGLNTDPLASFHFDNIDYAVYLFGTNTVKIYESGVPVQEVVGSVSRTAVCQIVYDGRNIVYVVNGTPVRTVPTTANRTFFLDSSLVGGRARILGWSASGISGLDGVDGIGIDGKLVEFVWKRSASLPATPTGNGIPSGWTDDPPSGSDPLWMSKAKQELDGTLVSGETWSIPIRHDGPPGLDGSPGMDGDPGLDAFVVTSDISAVTIPCDAGGVPVSGALPIWVTLKARRGNVDVTSLTSWPSAIMTGCAVTNLGGGQYRIDSVGSSNGLFTVNASYLGYSQNTSVTFAKALAGRNSISVQDTTLSQAVSTSFAIVSDIFIIPFSPGQSLVFSVSGEYTISGAPAQNSTGRVIARFMYRNLTDGGAWTQAGSEINGTLAVANYNVFPTEPEHIPGSIGGSFSGLTPPASQKIYEVRLELRIQGVATTQALTFSASIQ